jgi:hypothetical protein
VARIIKSLDFSENWEVEIRPATEKRSINQNDLFWMWMDKLAKYFSKEDKKFTKDDIKDIVSHKFLGYESRLIGNTQIKDQLKSTRDLDKESFYFFMTQIDEWALGLGCMLPSPEDSQYRKLKEKNEGE